MEMDSGGCFFLQGLVGNLEGVELEIHERACRYVDSIGIGREKGNTTAKKRLMMRLRMEGYNASLCRSSCGEHEYIDVMTEERGVPTRLILDVDFKSQFELARPTAAYRKLQEALPSVFVGTEEKLEKVVELLCSAARRSLKESGLHVPPWRTAGYVQSKWLSCHVPAILLPRMSKIEVKKAGSHGGVGREPSSEVAISSKFSDMGICCRLW